MDIKKEQNQISWKNLTTNRSLGASHGKSEYGIFNGFSDFNLYLNSNSFGFFFALF